MSRQFKMDKNGSIVRTNNQSLESYYMNLRNMIDLYSDEANGGAEKPQDGWTDDTGNYGLEDLPDGYETTETVKACVKCNKDFKNDQELQSHVCSANQTTNNNAKEIVFINLADDPDLDDENGVPNDVIPIPRKKQTSCQNNIKDTKSVRPKGSSKTLGLDNDIPIIIDDVFCTSTPEKNVINELVGSKQNAGTNVSTNTEIHIIPNVIVIDDDSSDNSEFVSRNEDDDARVNDTRVPRVNNRTEVTGELINSDNVNVLEENSEVIVVDSPPIDYDKLSEVLDAVSTDLSSMLGTDEVVNYGLNIPPITTEESECVSEDVENDVPNIEDVNSDTILENDVPNIEDVNSDTILENDVLNIEDVNSDTILENDVPNIEDVNSNTILENDVPNIEDVNSDTILENDVPNIDVLNIDVNTDTILENDVPNIEDVNSNTILENDVPNIEDVNSDTILENDVPNIEDVNSDTILENDVPNIEDVNSDTILKKDDPKALKKDLDVLDQNVIEDSVNVIKPQSNSTKKITIIFWRPLPKNYSTVPQISRGMEVNKPNIICGRDLNDGNSKAVKNKINIIDSNNVEIEYLNRNSEGKMQVVHSKIILDKGIQLESFRSLDDDSMRSADSNTKMKSMTQPKNDIINIQKLPRSFNNVPDRNVNISTDFDSTVAKPDLLSVQKLPSNKNVCDLGKFVLEDLVCKKTTKDKITKSSFDGPITKTLSVKEQIISNEEEQINQNSETQEGDQTILTDSMLDIITSNPHTNAREAEHIMEIVANLEESIARDLNYRNVSTNTCYTDYDYIDGKGDSAVKRRSKDIETFTNSSKGIALEELEKDISIKELVKVSVPLAHGGSRLKKFKNKKTQTDSRRVKPSPQFGDEMREAGLFEHIQPSSQSIEGQEYKANFKYTCTICNGRFDRISRLLLHLRRHNKDLKFQCELCDSKFVVQYELDRHHRIVHLGNKKGKLDCDPGVRLSKNYPHKCDYCKMFFQTTSGLREHMKKRHEKEMFLMEANRPVKCDICQKKFVKSFIADHQAKAHTSPVVFLDSLPDLN